MDGCLPCLSLLSLFPIDTEKNQTNKKTRTKVCWFLWGNFIFVAHSLCSHWDIMIQRPLFVLPNSPWTGYCIGWWGCYNKLPHIGCLNRNLSSPISGGWYSRIKCRQGCFPLKALEKDPSWLLLAPGNPWSPLVYSCIIPLSSVCPRVKAPFGSILYVHLHKLLLICFLGKLVICKV